MTRPAPSSRCRVVPPRSSAPRGTPLPAATRTPAASPPLPAPAPPDTARRSWRDRALRGLLLPALVVAGYAFRDAQHAGGSRFNPWIPPLEHFLSWESFSEVEQTRSLLRALCYRSIAQIRADYLAARLDPPTLTGSNEDPAARGLAAAATQLHALAAEFAGTPEEPVVQQELLRVLHRSSRHDEWLDVFVRLVYTHPTHPIVTDSLPRAQSFARITERDAELLAALRHRGEIPQAFWPSPAPGDDRTTEGKVPDPRPRHGRES